MYDPAEEKWILGAKAPKKPSPIFLSLCFLKDPSYSWQLKRICPSLSDEFPILVLFFRFEE